MNKYAWFNIPVWIDMAVVTATCDTTAYKFAIILEIKCKYLFTAFFTSNLTNPMIHIFSLFFCWKQFYCRIISNWHIMEIPCITTSFVDDHIKKFIGCNSVNICSCIAYRCTEYLSVGFQSIHGFHNFIKHTLSTSSIIYFFITFQTD